ncbi:hypothetical protein QVH35_10135 [Candidatus Nitrosotenuis chungbukensis]|uniref:hypothetical protein n=1 Tax=Candidatus Nitrosotenuis chungbukensis TaxID=1353246 RepID=UPI002672E0A9|nr:hypothetical protein [Candidatus Nitrosotenuis chungbukensis]WKT57674.1 hypothetical protein QVH35_10135 [Candidatus Nitrosotenuis chungbukensis]
MMKPGRLLAGILFLVVILSMSAHNASGHGVGFETLPPKMMGDRKVTMEIASNVDNATNRRQVTFSMFDANTGITIRDVVYHVKTIKNNGVVFEGDYPTGNGALIFDLIPTEQDAVTSEEKNKAGFFDALIGTQKNTVEAQGKIFSLGGLYKFSIDVLSAEGYSAKTHPPVHFDAGISFPEVVVYQINDKYFGKQQLKVVTYYDLLDRVTYDPKTKTIAFSMPFEWSVSNIDQTSVIHEEVFIPKTFGSLQVSEYSASVNGILVSNQTITVDDFSKDVRTVHILLYNAELLRLNGMQGEKPDTIDFELFPKSDDFLLSATTENVQYKITLTANPEQISQAMTSKFISKYTMSFCREGPSQCRMIFPSRLTARRFSKPAEPVLILGTIGTKFQFQYQMMRLATSRSSLKTWAETSLREPKSQLR